MFKEQEIYKYKCNRRSCEKERNKKRKRNGTRNRVRATRSLLRRSTRGCCKLINLEEPTSARLWLTVQHIIQSWGNIADVAEVPAPDERNKKKKGDILVLVAWANPNRSASPATGLSEWKREKSVKSWAKNNFQELWWWRACPFCPICSCKFHDFFSFYKKTRGEKLTLFLYFLSDWLSGLGGWRWRWCSSLWKDESRRENFLFKMYSSVSVTVTMRLLRLGA